MELELMKVNHEKEAASLARYVVLLNMNYKNDGKGKEDGETSEKREGNGHRI